MSALELVPEEQTELETKVNAIVEQAKKIRVVDEATAHFAATILNGFDALDRQIVEFFRDMKKKADEAHKAICAAENSQRGPVKEGKAIVKKQLADWNDAERKRRDEEARIAAAEAERATQDERLEMAIELEEAGLSDLAEITLDQPVLPAIAIPQKVEVQGVTMRTTYSARVVDKMALVRAIAADPRLLNLVSENMTAINSLARAMRDEFSLPGCELVKSTNVASRR